jgi:hypothetical protein
LANLRFTLVGGDRFLDFLDFLLDWQKNFTLILKWSNLPLYPAPIKSYGKNEF